MSTIYKTVIVRAFWDDEAGVWVATSDDVPGLVLEAPDTDTLEAEIKQIVPQMLALNHADFSPHAQVPIELLQQSNFIAQAAS